MGSLLSGIAHFAINTGPTLLMLAVFALAIGGVKLIRAGNRQKGILMLVCAAVFLVNVILLTL